MELASCIFGILFNRHFGFWNRRYFLSGILDCLIVDIVILDLWIMDIIQLYLSCKGGTVIVIFMQLLEKDWKLYDQKLGGLIWIKSSDGFLKTKDWRKCWSVPNNPEMAYFLVRGEKYFPGLSPSTSSHQPGHNHTRNEWILLLTVHWGTPHIKKTFSFRHCPNYLSPPESLKRALKM